MKRLRNIAIGGCSLLLLCQCATRDDVRKLNYQVRAVNQKVEEVKTTTVDKMMKRQASSVSKIDQVDEELMKLSARIEENTHQEKQSRRLLEEKFGQLQTALEERIAANEKKLAELQQQLEQLNSGIESMQQARIRAAEQRAREAAARAERARQRTVMAAGAPTGKVRLVPVGKKVRINSAPVSSPSVSAPAVPRSAATEKSKTVATVQTVQTPDTVSGPFEQAMKKFNNKQYKEAYKGFEQVLAGNPKGARAAQILFYMGEALYNQGEYDLAILDYQKVISNHRKDSHTPAALLKQGMSFEKLTDNETAKIIYKKLIKEYAGSPEAEQAKKRLAGL